MSEAKYPPVALPETRHAAGLQAYCLGFEGAYEDYPWGSIVYRVGKGAKIFAFLGGEEGVTSVTVKATLDDASILIEREGIERARYVGQHGWVTVKVPDDEAFDLVRDLIRASYMLVGPKARRLAALR